jgi:hypothetical protein
MVVQGVFSGINPRILRPVSEVLDKETMNVLLEAGFGHAKQEVIPWAFRKT